MAFLNDINQIRQVQWGAKYLWDLKFVDPLKTLSSPWDQWFPAQDVEDNTAMLETFTVEAAMSTYKVPIKSQQTDLKVTFVDDAANSLYNFFDYWINDTALKRGKHVATLSEVVKIVQIVRLTPERKIITNQVRSLWVFPEGPLTWNGGSTDDAMNYTVSFVIAGKATDAQVENVTRGQSSGI